MKPVSNLSLWIYSKLLSVCLHAVCLGFSVTTVGGLLLNLVHHPEVGSPYKKGYLYEKCRSEIDILNTIVICIYQIELQDLFKLVFIIQLEWSPDIYYLWFVYLCTANRPAIVCIRSMDTACAHWDMYSIYATTSCNLSCSIKWDGWWYVGDPVININESQFYI